MVLLVVPSVLTSVVVGCCVGWPTQLVCTFSFVVFQDKAKRTQQGNLVAIWCVGNRCTQVLRAIGLGKLTSSSDGGVVVGVVCDCATERRRSLDAWLSPGRQVVARSQEWRRICQEFAQHLPGGQVAPGVRCHE